MKDNRAQPTSSKENPFSRLTNHIHHLFEDYLRRHPISDYKEHNALLDVRNLVIRSVKSFLNEPTIRKKYGVPIDSTGLVYFNHEAEAINLNNDWLPIPSDNDEKRPAGITNEEFKEFEEDLDRLFREQNMYPSKLHVDVTFLFQKAFLKPAENKPFKAGTYVRLRATSGNGAVCEICGENRVVDSCHIIPRRVNGTQKIDNILFLCPTHHRLFDTCMLSKEEWNKIGWGRKSQKSQIYAEKVLKVTHGKFWKKVDQGLYEKRSIEDLDVFDLRRLHRENAKDIESE